MSKYIQGRNQNQNNFDNDLEQKQQIIQYLYSAIEIAKYKYKILELEEDLQMLDVDKYVVSANFTGPNCLLVFIKIKDKFHSVLIDRKTLSYNPAQINYENLKTNRIRVALDQSIYDGTIFDGILIQQGVNRTFIITDCYYFRGKNLSDEQLIYKLINIRSYLDANYKSDNILNTIKLNVNKIYELPELKTLLSTDIPKTKNMNIRGLTFYPVISGTKLIYLFGNETKASTDTIRHNAPMQNNQRDPPMQNNYSVNKFSQPSKTNQPNKTTQIGSKSQPKTTVTYICKTNEPIFATLEIKKTETIDVYKLYAVEKIIKDNKTVLRSKKMGIAYIPTEKCSRTCRQLTNVSGSRVLVKCQFIQDKNKWLPLEQDMASKIPTFVSDIEKNMDILEDVYSDSE